MIEIQFPIGTRFFSPSSKVLSARETEPISCCTEKVAGVGK